VPEFVEPENWLPNSPDLNPVDYSVWKALQQLVYCNRRIWDVEHLKEVLQTCWEQIGQDVINRAAGQFHKQLSLVVAICGGHIEHRFDYCSCCCPYIIILTCFVVEIQNCILFACLYCVLPHLSFFLHFFLPYLLPYLFLSAPFPVGMW